MNVDSALEASHTRGTADANDTLTLEDGVLSVTGSNAAHYHLEGNELKVTAGAGGTIVSTAIFTRRAIPRVITFEYNHNGLRTKKTVKEGGVTTTYEYTLHGKLITHMTKRVEENGEETTQELHFFYDAQGRPAFLEYEGDCYRYIYNFQGDIVALANDAGMLIIEYIYDAWGQILLMERHLISGLGKESPFAYRGYIYDYDSKLYYLNSRYYSPIHSRFLQMDSVIVHNKMRSVIVNAFFYGNNTPTLTKDNYGQDAVFITDSSAFTHSSVLIQDENDEWYYFYWGASKEGSLNNAVFNMGSNSSLAAGKGNVCVIYEKIFIDISDNDEMGILGALNTLLHEDFESDKSKYGYSGNYDKALYLKGDFSASHKTATQMKQKSSNLTYSVTSMNCAHAGLIVLLAAYREQKNTNAVSVILKALRKVIPLKIHNDIAKNLPK